MKNIIKEWNQIDSFFSRLDSLMEKISGCFAKEMPDVELMIEAETNYLKKENGLLKNLQFPKAIEKSENTYLCPNSKCHTKILDILIEEYGVKHCPECGQRIFINEYRKKSF